MEDVPSTRILVVAAEGAARSACVARLGELGVEHTAVAAWQELRDALGERPHAGIMVEVGTKLRMGERDRKRLSDLDAIYPVVQFRLDRSAGTIRLVMMGDAGPEPTVERFIDHVRDTLTFRRLRGADRQGLSFNVLLAADGQEGAMRTVTHNVSLTGCFLVSVEPWPVGTRLSLRFVEVGEVPPVTGEVTWVRPWGVAFQMPGMGVRFDGLSAAQEAALAQHL